MDVKQKYTTELFDVTEDFVDGLQELDIRTGIKIARFINENLGNVKTNELVSTVLGGVVMNDQDEPITFALEVIKDTSSQPLLSDIQLVDMDEFLDLLNLNKKTNGFNQSKDS
jgi:hypothetical protein